MRWAVLAPPDGPNAKFAADTKHPNAPAHGMENIPDEGLRALVNIMGGDDVMSDHDISKQLTEEYGGVLLYNAPRIVRLRGDNIQQIICDAIP